MWAGTFFYAHMNCLHRNSQLLEAKPHLRDAQPRAQTLIVWSGTSLTMRQKKIAVIHQRQRTQQADFGHQTQARAWACFPWQLTGDTSQCPSAQDHQEHVCHPPKLSLLVQGGGGPVGSLSISARGHEKRLTGSGFWEDEVNVWSFLWFRHCPCCNVSIFWFQIQLWIGLAFVWMPHSHRVALSGVGVLGTCLRSTTADTMTSCGCQFLLIRGGFLLCPHTNKSLLIQRNHLSWGMPWVQGGAGSMSEMARQGQLFPLHLEGPLSRSGFLIPLRLPDTLERFSCRR